MRAHRYTYKGKAGVAIYKAPITKEEAFMRLTDKFGQGVEML